MTNRCTKPRVGLLALTLELYETLVPDLRPGRERWVRESILPALAPIADIRFEQAVYCRHAIDQAVRHFEQQEVDALLVICLTYAPSQLALPTLQRTHLPIIIWNTQELFTIDDHLEGSQMTANHGVHGTQDLSHVLLRSGVRFTYVTSHRDDPDTRTQLSDCFSSAAAVAKLHHARLGMIGYPFPGMGDLGFDSTYLSSTLGCQAIPLSVEDFNCRAETSADQDVQHLVATYRESYRLADDLVAADLDATARAELALRSLVSDHDLDAITYQFMAFGEDSRTVTLPFVGMSRMMADGVGFGGEGDLIAAAGTWLLNQLAPPATFSEIFTIDFSNNELLISHMGEANPALARPNSKIPLVARPRPITRIRGRQLVLVSGARPGPATLAALTMGPTGRWRLLASRIEIVDFGPLPSLAVPHFKIHIAPDDVRTWLTAYAEAGGPHHHAICFGDATARIRLAASFMAAEFIEV